MSLTLTVIVRCCIHFFIVIVESFIWTILPYKFLVRYLTFDRRMILIATVILVSSTILRERSDNSDNCTGCPWLTSVHEHIISVSKMCKSPTVVLLSMAIVDRSKGAVCWLVKRKG